MLILQQSRNTAMSIKSQDAQSHAKPIDTPKRTTGHFIALQRRDPAPPTITQMQASPTKKTWQATSPNPPAGSMLHNKQEPRIFSLQKGHPKHSNLRKGWEIFSIWRNVIKPTKPNKRGGDRESTWKIIQKIDSKDDPKSWKQNGVTNK